MSDAHFLDQFDTVACNTAVSNNAGSVNISSHLFNLLLYIIFFLICITQRFGRIIFDCIYHQAGHVYCPLSSFTERIVDSKTDSQLFAMLTQQFHFFIGVGRKLIESYDNRLTE